MGARRQLDWQRQNTPVHDARPYRWVAHHGGKHHHGRSGAWATLLAVVALYLTLSSVIAAGAVRILHARSDPAALAGPLVAPSSVAPRYLVLMVLDGARPDYLNVTSLPHLDALRAQGTQYTNAVDGLLEAETPAGHAAIATGSRPDRNGILGFDWGTDNDRYSLFSPTQMGQVEQILQDSHAPTIAGLYKQRYPKAKAVAVSGHKYYAAAPLGGPAADAIIYYQGDSKGRYIPVAVPGHMPPAAVLNAPDVTSPTIHLKPGVEDHLVTSLALSAVTTMHPRILLMNFPEFDWPLGHINGGMLDPAKVKTDMLGFDADLGRIEDAYRKAGILDQTLFVVTADHGMMPIAHFVPSSLVSNAVAQAGTTAPDIASNTGDYVWLADSTKAQAVADNVVAAKNPNIQAAYYLTTDALGASHYVAASGLDVSPLVEAANQYLLNGLINGHQPTVVVFGKEGVSFSDPKSNWKADHGGNSWQSQHVPLVLAGPGVRAGLVTSTPAQITDIAPTVLSDMGVSPTGMEGRVLTDALVHATAAATRARNAQRRQMAPIAGALRAQDGQQPG